MLGSFCSEHNARRLLHVKSHTRSAAWLCLALLPCILQLVHARLDHQRGPEGTGYKLRENNQTTVVDIVIEKNVTYGSDNDEVQFPGLDTDAEPTSSSALFTTLPGNPYILLWLAFAYFATLAGILVVLVFSIRHRLPALAGRPERRGQAEAAAERERERERERENNNNFYNYNTNHTHHQQGPVWDPVWVSRILQALILNAVVVAAQYLAMALDIGLMQEAFFVEVQDGIIDEPGRLLWRPIMPPIYWCRSVSWLVTTSLTLVLLLSFAGRPLASAGGRGKGKGKGRKGHRKGAREVPVVLQVYVLALNVCLQLTGTIATLAAWRDFSKWFYWVFGLGVWVMVLRQLWPNGALVCRIASKNKVSDQYYALVRVIFATWSLYPIVWAIGDGAATVRWELREVLYAALDVVSKTLFVIVFLTVAVPSALPSWALACTRFCSVRLVGHGEHPFPTHAARRLPVSAASGEGTGRAQARTEGGESSFGMGDRDGEDDGDRTD